MSFTYAIADLHGRCDLLDSALERVAQHAAGAAATIVLLGDYIDRGPDSRQVIERLMSFRSENFRFIPLKGNHEAMMWQTCNRLADLEWWVSNGGDTTLSSYSHLASKISVVPRPHLEWIAGLALMHIDRHRVYVHAGVDPAVSLTQQVERTLIWKLYPRGYGKGHGRRHVVHGHQARPEAPIVTSGKTNLDSLAWKTGRLVIGVFDDEQPGAASEYLEICGKPL